MGLANLDWIIIGGYIVFALGVGIFFSKRSGQSLSEYFVSGRSLPWWVVGTSMVATTFAADTPLAITGMVARDGIAGNWLWWNLAASHMLAVFFFSRLWRRAEIITDVELIEIRYSGKSAAFLRGFRSLWEGILLNSIVMGWVMLAMVKIVDVLFDLSTWSDIAFWGVVIDPKWQAIGICLIIAFSYSVLSGFWGVVITDLVQFVIAMAGSVALAFIAVDKAGGMENLFAGLQERFGTMEVLDFTPALGGSMMPWITFFAFISVNWWATKVVDGGGYIAQRMFAAKNERHSFLGTLWFAIAHYALRPWPWIIVALVSLVMYPELADAEKGYPQMVVDFLPAGLKGGMIAAFLAAFMSTIDTQLNWGASLITNDFYKRFINRNASEKKYIAISRWSVAFLMVTGAVVAYTMTSIAGAWGMFYAMTAGIGGVYIARWFWWRVNAWSEIVAWVSAAAGYFIFVKLFKITIYGEKLIFTALFSTASWVIATLVTKPVDMEKLKAFYLRVRPGSPFWKPVAALLPGTEIKGYGYSDIISWVAGVVLVYSALFGIGKLILGFWQPGIIYSVIALISGFVIFLLLPAEKT